MIVMLYFGVLLLMGSFVIIFEGAVNSLMWLEVIGYALLLLSLVSTLIPYFLYWKNRVIKFPTFE
jgi:hypothetical protein